MKNKIEYIQQKELNGLLEQHRTPGVECSESEDVSKEYV